MIVVILKSLVFEYTFVLFSDEFVDACSTLLHGESCFRDNNCYSVNIITKKNVSIDCLCDKVHELKVYLVPSLFYILEKESFRCRIKE